MEAHVFGTTFFDFWQELLVNLGAHSTTRDAGEIDFRAVHVVAKVAAHAPCRPVLAGPIVARARRHGPLRPRPAHRGAPRAQEPLRENPGSRRRNPWQDQKWRHQGTNWTPHQIKSTLLNFVTPLLSKHFFLVEFWLNSWINIFNNRYAPGSRDCGINRQNLWMEEWRIMMR